MILGIGTDIVEKERFRLTPAKLKKLAERICTEYELAEFSELKASEKQVYVAKKWAAKEAISKVWGTGIAGDTLFQNMEIRHNTQGKPIVCFYGNLLSSANTLGLKCHISLSDTDNTVVAYALAEYNPQSEDWYNNY